MPKKSGFRGAAKTGNPPHIIGFLLKSLHHTLRQRFDETLRKQGVELSFAQCAALFILRADTGVTGRQLALRAMVSAQTMNSALHSLELDGYIERRPHPLSRRADSWSLTGSGLEELERARQVGSAIFGRMLAGFDAGEVAAFEDYLRRSITSLGGDSVAPGAERTTPSHAQRRQNAGASSTRNV
jgi:DNA-binding MarR family transcriptional regulator